jgi:hypothetical protein
VIERLRWLLRNISRSRLSQEFELYLRLHILSEGYREVGKKDAMEFNDMCGQGKNEVDYLGGESLVQ